MLPDNGIIEIATIFFNFCLVQLTIQNLPQFKHDVSQFNLVYLEKLPLVFAENWSRKMDIFPIVRYFTFFFFLGVSVLGSWLHITILQGKVWFWGGKGKSLIQVESFLFALERPKKKKNWKKEGFSKLSFPLQTLFYSPYIFPSLKLFFS